VTRSGKGHRLASPARRATPILETRKQTLQEYNSNSVGFFKFIGTTHIIQIMFIRAINITCVCWFDISPMNITVG
jgi:hypothetical protein